MNFGLDLLLHECQLTVFIYEDSKQLAPVVSTFLIQFKLKKSLSSDLSESDYIKFPAVKFELKSKAKSL